MNPLKKLDMMEATRLTREGRLTRGNGPASGICRIVKIRGHRAAKRARVRDNHA